MHIDSATMRSTPETPLDTTDDDMDETWDIDADLTNAIDKYGTKIQCMTEDCDKESVAVWTSNLKDEPWHTCETCQEEDFGGWPEDFEFECHDNDDEKTNVITKEKDDITSEKGSTDLPVTTSTSSHFSPKDTTSCFEDKIEGITSKQKLDPEFTDESNKSIEKDLSACTMMNGDDLNTSQITITQSPKDTSLGNSDLQCMDNHTVDETIKEKWKLKTVLSIEQLNCTNPQICTTNNCSLLACLIYTSSIDPSQGQLLCLDCQEDKFGGWPEFSKIPLLFLRENHKFVLSKKCSKHDSPKLPDMLSSSGSIIFQSNTVTSQIDFAPSTITQSPGNKRKLDTDPQNIQEPQENLKQEKNAARVNVSSYLCQ